MKELIYRRTEAGYKIDRCARDLPKSLQASGTGSAMTGMPASMDQSITFYRQFRLSNGGLVVGTSYQDPFGNRKSGLADLLFAMDRDEAAELLESYPVTNRYFERKKKHYTQTGETARTWDELDVSVPDFAGAKTGDLNLSCRMLKGVFGSVRLLSALFKAMLDVASNNPRMIVIFGPKEEEAILAEHGRGIIESLFACLPPTIAVHIGYLCPGNTDEANALFGIRYCAKREISEGVRGFTYIFDLNSKDCRMPAHVNETASDYAEKLAELVFRGDDASVRRIQELKRLLDSPALFEAPDVPKLIGQFYHLVSDGAEISHSEMASLLDWRHKIIEGAEGDSRALDCQSMWNIVERWTSGTAFNAILNNWGKWSNDDTVYSQQRMKQLFEDGEKLYRLNRPEAESWPELYWKYLLKCARPDNMAGKQLVDEFCDRVGKAKDGAFTDQQLYWPVCEDWVYEQWRNGALFQNKNLAAAVRKLFSLDGERWERFACAEAELVIRGSMPWEPSLNSAYGRFVFERILKKKPDAAIKLMRKSLTSCDPFGDESALMIYERFYRETSGSAQLKKAYDEICAAQVKHVIDNADVCQILDLLDDLDHRGAFLSACEKLGYQVDVRVALNGRLETLTGSEGIYPLYPDDPATARRLAERLGGRWPEINKRLEQVNDLKLETLEVADFDGLLRKGWGTSEERGLFDHLQDLLWQKTLNVFENGPVNESLLAALALCNYRDGRINVGEMLRNADRIGISEKKLSAFCRKRRDDEAMRGLGYLARVLVDNPSEIVSYPGQKLKRLVREKYDDAESSSFFAGIPAVAAAVAAPLFVAGLAACTLGLFSQIGLL